MTDRPGYPIRVLFIVGSDAATSIPLEVAPRLRAPGFHVRILSFYRPGDDLISPGTSETIGARRAMDPKAWLDLYRLIREYRPNIVHLNHTVPALLGSLSSKVLGVAAVVVSEHHDHRDLKWSRLVANVLPLALADVVTCNSSYTSESFYWWEKALTRHSRVTVYNGVDIARIDQFAHQRAAVRDELCFSESDVVVGTVGRLVREKDHATLLRAVAEAARADDRLKVLLIGDGPLRSELECLAASLGLSQRVRFLGSQPRERVYKVLYGLDLFVMSSLTEGFCNAVVEAMVASVPVIATMAGALPEVVADAGRFIPAGSSAELSRQISELAEMSRADRQRLGEIGRTRAVSRFSIEKTASRYLDLYCTALGEKGSREGPEETYQQ